MPENLDDCPNCKIGIVEAGQPDCDFCREPADALVTDAIDQGRALGEAASAIRYALHAIETGRSEPLFVARDTLRNWLDDYTSPAMRNAAPDGEDLVERVLRCISEEQHEPSSREGYVFTHGAVERGLRRGLAAIGQQR